MTDSCIQSTINSIIKFFLSYIITTYHTVIKNDIRFCREVKKRKIKNHKNKRYQQSVKPLFICNTRGGRRRRILSEEHSHAHIIPAHFTHKNLFTMRNNLVNKHYCDVLFIHVVSVFKNVSLLLLIMLCYTQAPQKDHSFPFYWSQLHIVLMEDNRKTQPNDFQYNKRSIQIVLFNTCAQN